MTMYVMVSICYCFCVYRSTVENKIQIYRYNKCVAKNVCMGADKIFMNRAYGLTKSRCNTAYATNLSRESETESASP